MINETVAIVGIVIGAIASFFPPPAGPVIAVIAAIVSIYAVVTMARAAKPFVYPFTRSSWTQVSDREWELVIPSRVHKKPDPQVTCQERRPDGTYATFNADEVTKGDGTVVISIAGFGDLDVGRIVLT